MENTIYNSDNIELTLNETNEGSLLSLDLIDNHGHYDKTIQLSLKQAHDLMIALNSMSNEFDSIEN